MILYNFAQHSKKKEIETLTFNTPTRKILDLITIVYMNNVEQEKKILNCFSDHDVLLFFSGIFKRSSGTCTKVSYEKRSSSKFI